jgi:Family of unknown function (DUF6152)
MRSALLAALMFSALVVTTAPLRAHHSFAAEYDSKQVVTLKGVLTKVEWTNPHAYIYIDVKDDSGNVTTWSLEGYPPNTLKRTGFARDLLKIGDEITVTAYKAKDASFTGAAREITFSDGNKKFLGPAGQ